MADGRYGARMTEFEVRGRRPRRAIALAITAVVCFGLVAAIAVYLLFRDPDALGAAPATAAPSPTRLDAKAACALLVPTLDDAAEQVMALATKVDGSTVDWPRTSTIADDLVTIQGVAPQDMTADIEMQIAVLRKMVLLKSGIGDQSLDLTDFRASGLRLAGRCS